MTGGGGGGRRGEKEESEEEEEERRRRGEEEERRRRRGGGGVKKFVANRISCKHKPSLLEFKSVWSSILVYLCFLHLMRRHARSHDKHVTCKPHPLHTTYTHPYLNGKCGELHNHTTKKIVSRLGEGKEGWREKGREKP